MTATVLKPTRIGKRLFRWGEKTYIMGICNLSPDSFSGDGLGSDIPATLEQAQRMIEEGADIIDVGGESTRPGTAPLSMEDIDAELRLVIPAIERLASEIKVPISIDTYKSAVASRALKAGAALINDIWGLKRDPEIAKVAADANVPVVLMANERDAPPKAGILAKVLADLEYGINDGGESGRGAGEHHRRPGNRVREDAGAKPRAGQSHRRAKVFPQTYPAGHFP